MTEARLNCCIPGCKRGMTHARMMKVWGHISSEIICGKHWKLATKAEKRAKARLTRLIDRHGWDARVRGTILTLGDRHDLVWDAIKRRISAHVRPDQ